MGRQRRCGGLGELLSAAWCWQLVRVVARQRRCQTRRPPPAIYTYAARWPACCCPGDDRRCWCRPAAPSRWRAAAWRCCPAAAARRSRTVRQPGAGLPLPRPALLRPAPLRSALFRLAGWRVGRADAQWGHALHPSLRLLPPVQPCRWPLGWAPTRSPRGRWGAAWWCSSRVSAGGVLCWIAGAWRDGAAWPSRSQRLACGSASLLQSLPPSPPPLARRLLCGADGRANVSLACSNREPGAFGPDAVTPPQARHTRPWAAGAGGLPRSAPRPRAQLAAAALPSGAHRTSPALPAPPPCACHPPLHLVRHPPPPPLHNNRRRSWRRRHWTRRAAWAPPDSSCWSSTRVGGWALKGAESALVWALWGPGWGRAGPVAPAASLRALATHTPACTGASCILPCPTTRIPCCAPCRPCRVALHLPRLCRPDRGCRRRPLPPPAQLTGRRRRHCHGGGDGGSGGQGLAMSARQWQQAAQHIPLHLPALA